MAYKLLLDSQIIKFENNGTSKEPDLIDLDTEEVATYSGKNRCFIINVFAKKSSSGHYDLKFKIKPSPSINHKKYIYILSGTIYGEITILKNIKNNGDVPPEQIEYVMSPTQITIDSQKSMCGFDVLAITNWRPFEDGISIILKMTQGKWNKTKRTNIT